MGSLLFSWKPPVFAVLGCCPASWLLCIPAGSACRKQRSAPELCRLVAPAVSAAHSHVVYRCYAVPCK